MTKSLDLNNTLNVGSSTTTSPELMPLLLFFGTKLQENLTSLPIYNKVVVALMLCKEW